MTFFAMIIAVFIAYKAPQHISIKHRFNAYAHWLEQKLYAGERQHVAIAWVVGALLPALLIAICSIYAMHLHTSVALVISVAVLYFCLQDTQLLFANLSTQTENEPSSTIQNLLISAFEGILGPIIWFILLGPAGALLYRLTNALYHSWAASQQTSFLRLACDVLNWLPSRLCAGSFAVVADFEDAVYCWREQSLQFQNRAFGILISSGAGALGVKLNTNLATHAENNGFTEIGLGEYADHDSIKSTIGMIWRVLILIVAVVLLLTLASWMG